MTDAEVPPPGIEGSARAPDRSGPEVVAVAGAAGARPSRPEDLYRDAYALVVRGPGLPSERLVQEVVSQCEAHGVDVVVQPVADVRLGTLDRYDMVFLVLEVPHAGRDARIIRVVVELLKEYRHRRPEVLGAILQAGRRIPGAGAVRLILWGPGRDAEGADPTVGWPHCTRKVVADHRDLGDLFEVYRGGSVDDPSEALILHGRRCWALLRSWGVRSSEEVSEILRIILDCVSHYDDERFQTTRRPLLGVSDHNRLKLVLEEPQLKPRSQDFPGIDGKAYERKKTNFKESGAKVVRYTREKINDVYPWVSRPNGRDKTKGSVAEFHEFYQALTYVSNLPAEFRQRLNEP
ncbi:hypothetical protein SUDANB95_03459 [Actinosynnema sp. ALI-1.44]